MGKVAKRFVPVLVFVGVIWGVYLADLIMPIELRQFGIVPRRAAGLVGIVCGPFLHGGLAHIVGNTVSLLIFGGLIAVRSSRDFVEATLALILLSGVGVWLFGGYGNHLGASGVIFGYFGYIVTRGLYDRDFVSIAVGVVVFFLFGGMLWGVLPVRSYISWESHLFGFLGGFFLARMAYRRST